MSHAAYTAQPPLKRLVFGVLAVIAVAVASGLGQIATFPNLTPWYASLAKPFFNPPPVVFGPVWTTLYALMAFAVWRILCLADSIPGRQRALILFFAQLVLNAAWSWMFFAAHNPLLGLINIVPQFMLIVASITAFLRLDRTAGVCLMPLAFWVAFASVLNFEIWRLNG